MTCGETTMAQGGGSAAEMVAAARSRVRSLTPRALAAELDHHTLVVDVREAAEQAATGRIPGAMCVPRGALEFWADPGCELHRDELDPARQTLVYCATGERSALAADTLRQLGYRDVAHLEGGFEAWRDCGFPVEP